MHFPPTYLQVHHFSYIMYVVLQYPIGRPNSILKLELHDLSRDSWLV